MSAAAITHRRVLAIAGPIVLSNATIPILGAVDTAVIGQLGQAAPIGAVGLGAVILTTIYWVFGFLRMGTTGMVAQARGAGDIAETGALLMRGLMIAVAAGLVFIVGQAAVFWAAFRIAPASVEVEVLARAYLGVRIWGAPATIAIYALTGWLIAMERTRGVLALQLVMNGLNVALSVAFVLALGWGVRGVAAATLIALAMFALPPMITNSYVAVRQVPGDVKEAAKGMGMTSAQRFWRVELPLAMPLVVTSLR